MEYSGISSTITLGHTAGRDDPHPAKRDSDTYEVRWPWHSSTVEFCAACTSEYLVDAMLDAAQQGRHALAERYPTTDDGPEPWAGDPNVKTRQPAFCPYCGYSGAFDGQWLVQEGWYRHGCGNCGYSFATQLPSEVADHA